MNLRNTTTSYGSITKFFHWLIFILLFFMIIFGYCLDMIPKEYKGSAYNIHKLTGLTILVLMLLRALWALMNPKPQLNVHALEHGVERTMHLLLYLTVIAMPLAGWIGASAANKPPHIGSLQFILPVAQTKSLADTAFNLHGILAITIIVLFSLHVLAALYHHIVRKDDVLRRMMPHGSHH